MENASKALLIAAAVLVVIVLIAFGMKIFNSTEGTSSEAQEVGQAIEDTAESASSLAMLKLGKIDSDTDPNKLFEQLKSVYSGRQSLSKIKELYNLLAKYNPYNATEHDHNKPHISCSYGVVQHNGSKIDWSLLTDKEYDVQFGGTYTYSIVINKVN